MKMKKKQEEKNKKKIIDENLYKIPSLWEEQEAPEYDIDTEDERWLKQQRHPELTDLKFEQMMDKLEKSSGQTVVTLNEAKLLLERHDDLVIAVYDYWLNKRLSTVSHITQITLTYPTIGFTN
nr:enhancer of polycomb homolog 2-like [Danaus plexippus plexippus]